MSNLSNNLELTPFLKGKIKLYQPIKGYRFNLDPILLSSFLKINKKYGKIIDLGTGVGIIPILLNLKYPNLDFYAVEIQKNLYKIAEKNFKLNNIKVNLLNEDIKNLKALFKPQSFDYIVSNPPYFKVDKYLPVNEEEKIAKFEIKLKLNDLFTISKYLLKDKGKLFLIYPTSRFTECLNISSNNRFKLKRLRFIHPSINSSSTHFLGEFVKSGKEGLTVEKTLIVYKDTKNKIYSEEVKYILEKFHNGEKNGA